MHSIYMHVLRLVAGTDSVTWVAVHSYYPQAAKMQPQFLPCMHGVDIPCNICPNLCLYCRSSTKLLVPPSPTPHHLSQQKCYKTLLHFRGNIGFTVTHHEPNLLQKPIYSKQLLWLSQEQAMAIVCMPNTYLPCIQYQKQ